MWLMSKRHLRLQFEIISCLGLRLTLHLRLWSPQGQLVLAEERASLHAKSVQRSDCSEPWMILGTGPTG